jgi:hypothetical protein
MNKMLQAVLAGLIGIAMIIGGTYWMWFTHDWDNINYRYTGKATVQRDEVLLAVANFDAKILAFNEGYALVSVDKYSPTQLENAPTWISQQSEYSPTFGKVALTATMVAIGLCLSFISFVLLILRKKERQS